MTHLPRFAPDQPLPSHAFVPGGPFPRPTGGLPGCEHAEPLRDDWPGSGSYLYGFDLLNHGYYWEAHEVWETLWHACGRTGPVADCVKALIKLAAAGVKVREGTPAGVQSHARRAAELFREVAQTTGKPRFLGLDLNALAILAEQLAGSAPPPPHDNSLPVVRVFDFVLCPRADRECP
jgi:hypothetical protein